MVADPKDVNVTIEHDGEVVSGSGGARWVTNVRTYMGLLYHFVGQLFAKAEELGAELTTFTQTHPGEIQAVATELDKIAPVQIRAGVNTVEELATAFESAVTHAAAVDATVVATKAATGGNGNYPMKTAGTTIAGLGVLMLVLAAGLGACSGFVPPVNAASVAIDLATAKTDVANAVTLYQTAEGLANVAAPNLSPGAEALLMGAEAIGDPIVTKAQTALAAASTDATTLEGFATTLTQQYKTLFMTGAPVITVVPNKTT